ncbi:hypothetical protein EmuJ_000796800 [Echinococcus multilocularis]|uniref:Uncharacterized protein n=1 Tax=Echinococcus multilocularis TaxID=6211 RepID=A0A068YDI7_ECHMU|nr:hypothetical protein EmuJ_000796800 [Echinococcus multilocularis]
MKDGQYNASFWGQIYATKHRMNSCDSSVSQIPTAEPGDLATPSTAIQPASTVVEFQGADFSCRRVLWKFDLEVDIIN